MKLNEKITLVSGSPRRKQILEEAGFTIIIRPTDTDESFDPSENLYKVPEILARRKVEAALPQAGIIIGADTVVIVEGEILNKPSDYEEAFTMLKKLSGKAHEVVTGVCISDPNGIHTFSDCTKVHFKTLEDAEIDYYIKNYKPFDKAGSYGVQDFIGMAGIERIDGSFYTVMGLPIHLIYSQLKPFITWEENK